MPENVFEDLAGHDAGLAGDLGKVIENKTKVFSEEIRRDVLAQTGEDARQILVGLLERLIVPYATDNDVTLLNVGDVGGPVNGLFKDIERRGMLGTDGDDRSACNGFTAERTEVALVADGDERFACSALQQVGYFCFGGYLIKQPEHDAGFGDGVVGALYANLLYLISSLADAGSVDKTEGDALDVDNVFDGVSCRAMHVGDNRPLILQQTVEQG